MPRFRVISRWCQFLLIAGVFLWAGTRCLTPPQIRMIVTNSVGEPSGRQVMMSFDVGRPSGAAAFKKMIDQLNAAGTSYQIR
jgi:hypothetical protein